MEYYKSAHRIADLLERSADRFPEKDAFRYLETGLTYRELQSKSGRLATSLIKAGVKSGDRVGIFLNQSLDTPVAIYGILGAGACFVPIDPLSPPKRVCQILNKCGVQHLVSNGEKLSAIKEIATEEQALHSIHGIGESINSTIESIGWDEIDRLEPTPPVRGIEIDLAYIMFTSGSTGTPKGMMHTHANGLIYADNLAHVHGLLESDRFLNLAPLHFDMAVMDYIASPMVGGTTIIVPESYAKLPASLTALAAREKATIWYSVPFAMTQMLQYGAMEKHDLSALRWMIYGGEAIPIKHLRALMQALPNARFCNAYGPAETHQVSSYNIDELPSSDTDAVPIGEPWRTVDVLIVDGQDEPVRSGEPGELLVRAPSCMRGYWGDPDRTQAAFYSRTVVDDIVDTYYRTGDVVTMDSDSMMYFHGRIDRQTKIRGYRVELDEVEAVVADHILVNECAVIKSGDGKSLIAYVSFAGEDHCGPDEIARHCNQHLPGYAVPVEFHHVNEFPRTSSQKIDRSQLANKLKL